MLETVFLEGCDEMNILMISPWYLPYEVGGAEVFAHEIAKRLANKGHTIQVLTRKRGYPLSSEMDLNDVHIHYLPYFNVENLRSISFILSAFQKGRYIIQKNKIDLIHAHLAFPSGIVASLFKLIEKKPSLVTIQGGDVGDYAEFTGKFYGVLTPFIKLGLRGADRVHVVSTDLKKKIVSFDYSPDNIHLVPNGVDFSRFSPRINGRNVRKHYKIDGPIILSVSRLVPKNGLDTLIQAFKIVKETYHDTYLMIVGEGYLKSQLERMVKKLNLENNTIFVGYVRHDLIHHFYAAADIFVRTPVDEGFGIVFIEAMASGVPVVATNVGGITDIIQNKKNGILIPPNDPYKLAEVLNRLLQNEQMRKKLGYSGRDSCQDKYNWDSICSSIMKIYKIILSSR
ncbi:MAG: glycosyltransferase family 4 protein [Candidatus Hodarchaeota archaeon]